MDLIQYQESAAIELKSKLEAWTALEPTLAPHVQKVTGAVAKGIATQEERDAIHKMITSAAKARKAYEKAALDARRPVNGLADAMGAHEKAQKVDIEAAIDSGRRTILLYEAEQAKKQQQELARLEALRKEQEAEERAARERDQQQYNRYLSLRDRVTSMLDTRTVAELEEGIPSLDEEKGPDKYGNYWPKAQAEVVRFRTEAPAIIKAKREQEEREAEAKRLEAENSAAAAKLVAQNNEIAKLKAEAEAAKRKAEQQRAEAEEEQRRLQQEQQQRAEAEALRLEAEQAIKQQQEKRLKGITQGVEGIELTNIHMVPDHLYSLKWNMAEVKKYLKENGSIPGANVTLKNKLILNAK